MNLFIHFICLPTLILFAVGCGGAADSTADSGPFGPVKESLILSSFAGEWVFDFEKTLDSLNSAGASEEDIEQLRKLYTENPQIDKFHPDIKITGDIAIGSGILSSEYRFYAMHQHDEKICGKAWHHEDRFDPGDMSECYIRLVIKDNLLYLDVKMKEGRPDLNDPVFRESPPIKSGSSKECDAENPAGINWGEWTTFIFFERIKSVVVYSACIMEPELKPIIFRVGNSVLFRFLCRQANRLRRVPSLRERANKNEFPSRSVLPQNLTV